jgi:DNA-binding transcriptional LysR family regulator
MTRAAKALHLTQPAVSAQLSRLEEDLGVSLFHRTPKGMALTDAGTLFRHHVEEALLWLEDGRAAVQGLADLAHGSLAIGAGATATTYLLPPLLRVFHERHPGIQIQVREQGSQAIVDAVLAGTLDLGVVTLPVDPAARLAVTPWVDDELRLIVPPGHPLHKHRTYKMRDLDGQPVVLFEAGTAVRRLIDHALAEGQAEVEIVMELRSIESIKQMVAQGIGSAFVSQHALKGGEGLTSDHSRLRRTLAAVHRSDRAPSAAARAFLALMEP